MAKYYAWTKIHNSVERDKIDPNIILKRNFIKIGSEVSASKLGIDEEEFQALVDAGSVRTMPYPDCPNTVSPVDHYRNLAKEASEGAFGLDPGFGLGNELMPDEDNVPDPDDKGAKVA